MRLISVNVGQPRDVEWQGRLVTTAIFKEPLAGPVMLRAHNLDGDRQADLSVHGGAYKAVYAYPSEHYAYWHAELPGVELPWGKFGENFTVEGLLEDQVCIGDRFRVGGAEVVVSEPRVPCYKLGLKFGDAGMVKRFLGSRRTGFYFAVAKEGMVRAGDSIEPLSRDPARVSVAEVFGVYTSEADADLLRRIAEVEALSPVWREFALDRLGRLRR